MACSLLAGKTEEGLCGICSEELHNPIGLPCLHGFCCDCLEDWYKACKQESNVVSCPACQNTVTVPAGGIRGFPRLLLLKTNQGDSSRMEKAKEEEPCRICANPATIHCIDCKKSLCRPCQVSHNNFMKDHKFITIKELQSGGFSDEGRLCQLHGEQVRYFCETEQKQACPDCVSLHTCAIEHKRITLKEAAQKQRSSIKDLMKKVNESTKRIQNALDDAGMVIEDLNISTEQAIAELDETQEGYVKTVEQEITVQKDKVKKLRKERGEEIEKKFKTLKLQKDQMVDACKQAQTLSEYKSEYQITYKYSSLSGLLSSLAHVADVVPHRVAKEKVDFQLDVPKFELPTKSVSEPGHDHLGKWAFVRRFHPQRLNTLQCIAVNHDGDIAIGSQERGVKLYSQDLKEKGVIDTTFSRKGQIKNHQRGRLQDPDSSLGVIDIAVTPDNRYVIAPVNEDFLQFHDKNGSHLFTRYIKDINDKPSNLNSVATDTKGRIFVGQVQNTISIHYADGSPISKFATMHRPSRLNVTSNNEIVCCFYENEVKDLAEKIDVQIFDSCGMNSRVIQPPPDVTIWSPDYVLCSDREIFVGSPPGVFRYTSDGKYLDCITNSVKKTRGMAVSNDGNELFVTDGQRNVVMIFQRVKQSQSELQD